MRSRGVVVVLGIALAAPARADWRSDFQGWSYDGTAFGLEEHNAQMHGGWFACPRAGGECTLVDGTGRERFAEVPRPPPRGVRVRVAEKPGKTAGGEPIVEAVVTVSANGKSVVATTGAGADVSIERIDFSPDARAVVVSIEFQDGADNPPSVSALVIDVASLRLRPTVDRRRSKAINATGLAAHRRGEWDAARRAFEKSIALDVDYGWAHYNLASVASIQGDVATALRELRWLAAATDARSRTALAKAKVDADLDFASIDPDVRAVIGLPPYPADTAARLTERRGTWSNAGVTCKTPAIVLTFGASDALSITAVDECNGQRTQSTKVGTWRDGALSLDAPFAGIPAKATIAWTACDRFTDGDRSFPDGTCFALKEAPALKSFRRGIPLRATK
jgi:hypothetical protein